jgi:hypothetical protein
MGRRGSLPLASPAPSRRTPLASPEEGTSYQSLQPTCCQRVPTGSFHSRTLGSRRPDHRFRRCSCRPHAHTIVGSAAFTTAPDSRKRHLRPRVVTQLLLRSPAATFRPPCPPGPPAPFRTGRDLRSAYLAARKPRGLVADAPCHAASSNRPESRLVSAAPRTLSTSDAPTPLLSRPEAPSAAESPSSVARAGA